MSVELAAFFAVAIVVIVTPGQDTALTVKNTLAGGRSGGVFTALGVVSGPLIWALATSLGLAGLILASERALDVLKLVGAGYLVYLGCRALLSAARGLEHAGRPAPPERAITSTAAYRQGVVSNLSNPKIAVFFTSLLPQFVHGGHGSFAGFLLLGALFAATTLLWLSGYASAVAKFGNVLRRPGTRRLLDAATGSALIVLGLRLALEGERR